MSNNCGGCSADKVLDIASGAFNPGGRSAPGGSGGKIEPDPDPDPDPEPPPVVVVVVVVIIIPISSIINNPSVAFPSCEKSTLSFLPMISWSSRFRTALAAVS
jgi:hypothetical protein